MNEVKSILPNSRFVLPSSFITEDMIERAKTDDAYHFASNLNAMMRWGYCIMCGLVPTGCVREGCQGIIKNEQEKKI